MAHLMHNLCVWWGLGGGVGARLMHTAVASDNDGKRGGGRKRKGGSEKCMRTRGSGEEKGDGDMQGRDESRGSEFSY